MLVLPASLSAALLVSSGEDPARGIAASDVESAARAALLPHLSCPADLAACESSRELAVACTARGEDRHDCVAASSVRVDGVPRMYRFVGVYAAATRTFTITFAEHLWPAGEAPAAV